MLVSKLHTSYKSIIQLVFFNVPIPKKVSNFTFFGIRENREESFLEKVIETVKKVLQDNLDSNIILHTYIVSKTCRKLIVLEIFFQNLTFMLF